MGLVGPETTTSNHIKRVENDIKSFIYTQKYSKISGSAHVASLFPSCALQCWHTSCTSLGARHLDTSISLYRCLKAAKQGYSDIPSLARVLTAAKSGENG